MRLIHALPCLLVALAAAGQPGDQAAAGRADEKPERIQPFPGVTVDHALRQVEIEGFVPVDVNQAETPEVIIEVIGESGGVRDFEALVGLHAEATHVHAALLLLGLQPGQPGAIRIEGQRIEPTGPAIEVRVVYERDGDMIEENPAEWVVPRDPERAGLADRSPRFVFAGSTTQSFGQQSVYMAAAEGVVVGLCTFGTEPGRGVETVGMVPVLSPDTASGDPIWLADPDRVPPFDTPVTLVLRATDPDETSGSGADRQGK